MAKIPKLPKKNDEEYKFSDEAEEQLEVPEKPQSQNLLKKVLANKKIVVIVVVLVAVFVVYQFIGTATPVKQELSKITSEPVLQPVPARPQLALAPVATTPIVDETQQQLQTLSAQTQENQQQMQQLQNNMQQLQGSVAQLGNQIGNLSNTVAACPRTVTKVVSLPIVKPVVKAQPKIPFYTVRAVVPGRAWLQQKKNNHIVKLITVRVGDNLPGYGRVQAISPSAGKVWTSWGNVIRYGANDS